jgi:hypothetical protein
MKYIISEALTGDIVKVYHDLEDAVGNEYFYFKHLVESQKQTYREGSVVYSVAQDDLKIEVTPA